MPSPERAGYLTYDYIARALCHELNSKNIESNVTGFLFACSASEGAFPSFLPTEYNGARYIHEKAIPSIALG